jgi:hypothetical protein
MTTQPTTGISTPIPPVGPTVPPGPSAPPAWGAPQPGQLQSYGPPPYGPPASGPGYPAPGTPPKRSTGKVVGLVAVALVLLAGVGIGALVLFGPRSVDPQSVQHEIVRITQTAAGIAPTDVRCPDKITAQAGGTFTCTATVDQQQVTYDVRQDDDKGHLTITYNRLIKVADLENTLATKVRNDTDVTVEVTCGPAGRIVLVDPPGKPITCTATNAADPTDSATLDVTVDATGTPSYTFA